MSEPNQTPEPCLLDREQGPLLVLFVVAVWYKAICLTRLTLFRLVSNFNFPNERMNLRSLTNSCSIMFVGELQSGKHSRINYFPFNRYSTYYFYHVLEFDPVFRSKIQSNLDQSNQISMSPYKQTDCIHCMYSQGAVKIQSNPCTYSVYSLRAWVKLKLCESRFFMGQTIIFKSIAWDFYHGNSVCVLSQIGFLHKVPLKAMTRYIK